MGPVFYVMVLLGCHDDGRVCEPMMTLPVAYESQAKCLAERTNMVNAGAESGSGKVIAECRPKNDRQRAGGRITA